ncbi:efflux RND transporter permease subunit [Halomonas heilongjiangensis]|uniref:AcrB/AcrD/AcrF family protein n=1 Tax=Halomonas heilongjiangensis TaxID=1387883 RepID=A0A2N7TQ35_9GAMM|nr:efflux RND transporter permease subunit [Halomonas heilongjiangensis]PMR70218.1 AcrB/AcrD/AcrF family protein [Halomonas heilongjiangensis]PXX92841.1 acriflavin resistance protein [Halomonas heilongjiangensis]
MIRWFAGHPTAANLLLLLLVAAGLFAAPGLKRETFPDYRPVEARIEVVYRGASAADVEDAVCRRLFDALKGVEFLDEFACVAQDNLASATATLEAGGDAIRFLSEIDTEVGAITDLPARAERPVVRELHRSDPVAAVAVSGDMPRNQLEDYARVLEERLMRLPGVADVTVQGMSQRQWQVEVPREVLGQHGLSARELGARIRRQSLDMPLGTLETRDRDILLRFTDQRRSLRELERLVVVSDAAGGELTLGEIATLREVGERPEEQIRFDGEPALVLEVNKSLRDDALDVKDALEALLEAERRRLDGRVALSVTQDMTGIVRDRLRMLVSNGLLGLALVVLVMSLFFRPRLALWAVLGLPAAFMGAFLVMALSGLSLNMITLVALLMAIGIVMDDAIVITDGVAAHAREGAPPLEAVVAGTRQVLPGVLSSFLTTVAVFAPLSFLAGELGAVLEVLPVVLIAALAASLVEAFWILPHHLKGSVERLQEGRDSRLRAAFERGFAGFRERVGRAADAAIRFRHAVLGGVLAVLLGSVGFLVGGHIGSEAMPDIDGDVLEARILMPQGTPLHRTEAVAERVEAAMRRLDARLTPDQPGGAPLVEAIQVRFNHNPSARESGAHVATVMVDLLTAERRRITLGELTAAWREELGEITGLQSLIIQEPGIGPAGVPVEVRLQGEDLDALKAAARELAAHLEGYAAVYNVIDDLRPGKPQRAFALAEGAHGLGLTAEEVASQLRAALLGEIADTQRIGDRDVEILVRQAGGDRDSLDDLLDQTIVLPDGRRVPLEVVATLAERRDWARITRIDGRRTVTVEANVEARLASGQAIVDDLRSGWLAAFRDRHPAVEVSFEGQVARAAKTGASIRRGLLIGLVGIFVVLSFQFRSYVEPLIVMVAIPLAFLGAIWGHVAMGYYLSMPSLVGAVSLAGIVVNNAILLIHFIKGHREAGLSAVAAAGRASRDRLRAILISSTTTIVGLLPLLAETSTQAVAIKPLVISVVFGLLGSTVLVLLVIPALYVLLDDRGWTRPPQR